MTEIAVIIRCIVSMSAPAIMVLGSLIVVVVASQLREVEMRTNLKYRHHLHIATGMVTVVALLMLLVERVTLYWP